MRCSLYVKVNKHISKPCISVYFTKICWKIVQIFCHSQLVVSEHSTMFVFLFKFENLDKFLVVLFVTILSVWIELRNIYIILFTCKINHTYLRYLLIVHYVRNMYGFHLSSSYFNCHAKSQWIKQRYFKLVGLFW